MWRDRSFGAGGEPDTDPNDVTVPPYLPDTNGVRNATAR